MAQLNDLIVTGSSRFLVDINGNLNGNAATATSATSATKAQITTTQPASAATYYVPWVSGAGNQSLLGNDGCRITMLNGTTSANGTSQLVLGNSTATGTANNKQGSIRIYGKNTGYGQITYSNTTSDSTHTFPSTGGTILNTGTTSFTQTLTSGTKIGSITINGTSTDIFAPTTTSSSRLIKKNIAPVSKEEVNGLLKLEAVKFDFKDSKSDNQAERGFIAEDVKEILPCIEHDEVRNDQGEIVEYASINYMAVIPLLVELCKQQQKEIDELKKFKEEYYDR